MCAYDVVAFSISSDSNVENNDDSDEATGKWHTSLSFHTLHTTCIRLTCSLIEYKLVTLPFWAVFDHDRLDMWISGKGIVIQTAEQLGALSSLPTAFPIVKTVRGSKALDVGTFQVRYYNTTKLIVS